MTAEYAVAEKLLVVTVIRREKYILDQAFLELEVHASLKAPSCTRDKIQSHLLPRCEKPRHPTVPGIQLRTNQHLTCPYCLSPIRGAPFVCFTFPERPTAFGAEISRYPCKLRPESWLRPRRAVGEVNQQGRQNRPDNLVDPCPWLAWDHWDGVG